MHKRFSASSVACKAASVGFSLAGLVVRGVERIIHGERTDRNRSVCTAEQARQFVDRVRTAGY